MPNSEQIARNSQSSAAGAKTPASSDEGSQSQDQQTVTAWVAIVLMAGTLALLTWLLVSHLSEHYFTGEGETFRASWEWRAFGWLLEKGESLSVLLAPAAFAVPIAVGLIGKIYRTKIPLFLFSLACLAGAALVLVLNISLTGANEATQALVDNACEPAPGTACDFPKSNAERFAKMNALREAFLLRALWFFVGALLLTLGLTPEGKKKIKRGWEKAMDTIGRTVGRS